MIRNRILNSISYSFGMVANTLGKSIKNPIFILGTGRCGTTLLHRILKSNKNVCIYPTEANELWHPSCFPYSKVKKDTPPILMDPRKFTEISIKEWPNKHGKYIKTAFTGFSLLNYRCTIFVVKSAMISFMIPTILSLFKDARFIHIYRNGISVTASLFKKERQKYINMFPDDNYFSIMCAKYWVKCITEVTFQDKRLSLENRKILYQISYEDLCSNPQKKIKELAAFIGCTNTEFSFDYSEILSTNYKVGNYADKRWELVLKTIYTTMVDKGYLL